MLSRKFAPPSWSSLNGLGRSAVLRSSYYWFFVVPIAAKALAGLDVHLGIRIALPFSWQLLYYASVSSAIASAIYSVACPRIVQKYDSYRQLADEGQGWDFVAVEFARALGHRPYPKRDDIAASQSAQIDELTARLRVEAPRESAEEFEQPCLRLDRIVVPENMLPQAFWYVRNAADRARPTLRFIATFAYIIAFAMLILLAIKNVQAVAQIAAGSGSS